ncbi:hypothetical protein BpHYR1_015404 [Brachionus plicatilis]|uniref:Uncharacterized protein n=1 Tax=Brachionus plicatilis TaxID=10195 RepID=A0A3M7QAI2_BRAPC|nr:hypothetical protein BpHYR1_015404 [Brachionus plicatilis]
MSRTSLVTLPPKKTFYINNHDQNISLSLNTEARLNWSDTKSQNRKKNGLSQKKNSFSFLFLVKNGISKR